MRGQAAAGEARAGVGLILDPWLPLVLYSLSFSKRKSEPEA